MLTVFVALRKESVDRNINCTSIGRPKRVALRKESVDRNSELMAQGAAQVLSLSARRAWIEILYAIVWESQVLVALRKESVDRNMGVGTTRARCGGRSPQGERG